MIGIIHIYMTRKDKGRSTKEEYIGTVPELN
uniref:Uncharacterized protein n=1 Tax=Setaria italica TaxID=4555 RepID=K3ZGR8_SETIT